MKNLQELEKRFLITAGCFFLISIALLLLPLCGRGETGMGESGGYRKRCFVFFGLGWNNLL